MNYETFVQLRDMLNNMQENMEKEAIAGNEPMWKYVMKIFDITTFMISKIETV